MPNLGLWQGLEKSTGRMATTGMQLLQYKQQRAERAESLAMDKDRLRMQKESHAIDMRTKQAAEDKIAKDARLSSMDQVYKRMGVVGDAEKKVYNSYFGALIEPGPASGVPSIQFGYLKESIAGLRTNTEVMTRIAKARATDAESAIKKTRAILDNPEAKLKPEERKELEARIEGYEKQRSVADTNYKRMAKEKEEKTLDQRFNEKYVEAEGTARGKKAGEGKKEKTWTQLPDIRIGNKTVKQQQSNDGEIKRYTIDGKNEKEIKPPSPQAAAKRLSDIEIQEANIDKADKITSSLAAIFPEYAKSVGQRITPTQKAKIKDALTVERAYLKRFSPDEFGYLAGETREKDGVMWEYIGGDQWQKR